MASRYVSSVYAARPGTRGRQAPWTRSRSSADKARPVALRGHPAGRIRLGHLPALDLVHEVVVVADRGGALECLPVAGIGVRQEVRVGTRLERGQDRRG